MKSLKSIFPVILIAMTLALMPNSLFGEFIPSVYLAARTSSPPVIDGILSEPEWGTTGAIDQFYAYRSGGSPAAATAQGRILWDDQFLYVGIHMDDVEIRSSCSLANRCGNDAGLFNGDVIELFIKERPGRTKYFEFEWSPLGEIFDAQFNNANDPRWNTPPGVAFDAAVVAAVQVDGQVDNASTPDRGWTVESAIPLADLQLAGIPTIGTEWNFTLARYDYFNRPPTATAELMMSTPGDPMAPNGGVTFGFHSYEIYDILRLSAVPEPGLSAVVGFPLACLLIRRRRR
jgi:Carbohydrate family 9 binding domain-like